MDKVPQEQREELEQVFAMFRQEDGEESQ
jgi:hypothetical protein